MGMSGDQDLEEMRASLSDRTPAGSFNPNQGIIENDETVFGAPPDVDGDGKTDVLVLNIRDQYDPANGVFSAVLGFFDPRDLRAPNLADIIYLDTVPGVIRQDNTRQSLDVVTQTLAHEYQHLIFSSFNGAGDISFVDEGLAEWAEVMNGFTARAVSYFQADSERRGSFLNFRGENDANAFGGPNGEDYQRAGLFTNYLSERLGILKTGDITKSSAQGAANYAQVLSANGLDLRSVIGDFHVANLINDTSIQAEYGFASPQYSNIRIATIPIIDGAVASSTPATGKFLNAGGAAYVIWQNVSNINITVDGSSALVEPRAVVTTTTGVTSTIPIAAGGEPAFLSGDYDLVRLIIPHTDIQTTSTATATYSASWTPLQPSVVTTNVIYDSGKINPVVLSSGSFGFLDVGSDARMVNRFDVPTGASLRTVLVDHAYQHDFAGSTVPANAARDYTLKVYGDDGGGKPGNELFSLDVTDQSQTGTTDFLFDTVDLEPFAGQLSSLPPVIYVGVANRGSDANTMVMSISSFTGTTPSYLFLNSFNNGNGGWARFDNVGVDANTTLDGFVLPIRATFAQETSTATEDEGVLPERVALEQNYPNPFNPATTIRFALPRAGRVSLRVFDMLGREIATLVDGFQGSGTHAVSFDASAFSSGLYLYSLETIDNRITRTMTLVK